MHHMHLFVYLECTWEFTVHEEKHFSFHHSCTFSHPKEVSLWAARYPEDSLYGGEQLRLPLSTEPSRTWLGPMEGSLWSVTSVKNITSSPLQAAGLFLCEVKGWCCWERTKEKCEFCPNVNYTLQLWNAFECWSYYLFWVWNVLGFVFELEVVRPSISFRWTERTCTAEEGEVFGQVLEYFGWRFWPSCLKSFLVFQLFLANNLEDLYLK